jgi:hypothetical protein
LKKKIYCMCVVLVCVTGLQMDGSNDIEVTVLDHQIE